MKALSFVCKCITRGGGWWGGYQGEGWGSREGVEGGREGVGDGGGSLGGWQGGPCPAVSYRQAGVLTHGRR